MGKQRTTVVNQPHSQYVAAYVNGTINVHDHEGLHSRLESELITTHEQFHHMLRLKSSFGVYLTRLMASIVDGSISPKSFVLQALASRFRTSDEVLATYASSKLGSWHYGIEPIRDILKRYPSYEHYFSIGESLVAGDAVPLIAAASVEAMVRFCWSPGALIDFQNVSIDDLYKQLPADQFPDKRFERFTQHWSIDQWRKQVEAMTSEIPDVDEVFALPYRQWIDPFYGVIEGAKAENRVFVMGADTQTIRSREMQANRQRLNEFAAALVWKGYEYLYHEFRGTHLASAERSLLVELMFQHTPTRDGVTELPEILFARTSQRRVTLDTGKTFEPWEYVVSTENARIAPVFIRPMSTLRRHLELPDNYAERSKGANEGLALYSIHAGLDVIIDPLQIRLVELSGWREVQTFMAERYRPGPAVVWTSDVINEKVDVRAIAATTPVWCVCDTPPLSTLAWLQQFLPELRGFFTASRVPGSALKALVAYRVGSVGDIDGIVFPGTATMCDPIGSMLFQVYGDNCRDLNSVGPMLFRDQIVLKAIGQVIVNFISITDGWFGMSQRRETL